MGSQLQDQKFQAATRAAATLVPSQSGVLLVEPDPDLQWRLARQLTVQGLRVVGTSTGDGALALLEQWPVDLVLVDEDLPTMSGLDTVRRIKATRPDTRVVLLTGDASSELRGAAYLAGVVGCLAKPFSYEALDELVEDWVVTDLAEPAE